MSLRRPRIAVVGSLNVDFTFRLPRIPGPGETLTARGMEVHFGGKGANQAVAAARAGAEVSLIGCIGSDEQGERYRAYLEGEGIRTDMLFVSDGPTGSAFIALDENGENSIIVHLGANAQLSIEHIRRCVGVLEKADAVLLQLECPLAVVAHAFQLARAAGVPVIVNPSPFLADAVNVFKGADVWILNQLEFDQLNGVIALNVGTDLREGPELLGAKVLVVTHGAKPTILITGREKIAIHPPQVKPVDTVGAGDTFAGAFAVLFSEAQSLGQCVRFANVAGALATLQQGAQSSMPDRRMIEKMLQQGTEAASIPLTAEA